jgi:hypothetical protein
VTAIGASGAEFEFAPPRGASAERAPPHDMNIEMAITPAKNLIAIFLHGVSKFNIRFR